MSWISVGNSGMILFLVFSRIQQEYCIEMDISKLFFPLYLGFILLMLLIGYIDDKLKLATTEAEIQQTRNPISQEILERLRSIEKQLGELT
jgi:UDP-N-acetylmuramyl pentapeptide phosphotransferase/UDP-N-acetylglucosamine-1-phosphate transferase